MKRLTSPSRIKVYDRGNSLVVERDPGRRGRNGLDGRGGAENSRAMLCEMCHLKEAMVLLGQRTAAGESTPPITFEHHFCEDCADIYYKSIGANSCRDLIQLSERYRSKLYDLLETQHPEVFNAGDDQLGEVAETMQKFLRAQLKQEAIEVNDDSFGMLFGPFVGSAEFYERRERHRRGDQN